MNRMGEFVDAAVIITNQVAKMEDVSATAFGCVPRCLGELSSLLV